MIIPGILEKYWGDIEDKIEIVYNRSLSGVDLSSQNIIYRERATKIQIDFCDGIYEKSQTWSPLDILSAAEINKSIANVNSIDDKFIENKKTNREIINLMEKGLPYWENFDYEADLMIDGIRIDNGGFSNMHKYIEAVAMLGFSHVVIHSDNETSLRESISKAKEYMLSVGISSRDINIIKNILNTSADDKDESLADKIDYVQIMGIENIGYQHEPFDESVIEKIKLIRDTLNSTPSALISLEQCPALRPVPREGLNTNKSRIRIQIDGAMNNETIEICREAGADDFVMGSAYFNK